MCVSQFMTPLDYIRGPIKKRNNVFHLPVCGQFDPWPLICTPCRSHHILACPYLLLLTRTVSSTSPQRGRRATPADDPWLGGNQSNAKPCNEMRARRSGRPENRKAPVTNLLIRLWQLHRSRTVCCLSTLQTTTSTIQWQCSFIRRRLIIIRRVITTVVLMACLSSLATATHYYYHPAATLNI